MSLISRICFVYKIVLEISTILICERNPIALFFQTWDKKSDFFKFHFEPYQYNKIIISVKKTHISAQNKSVLRTFFFQKQIQLGFSASSYEIVFLENQIQLTKKKQLKLLDIIHISTSLKYEHSKQTKNIYIWTKVQMYFPTFRSRRHTSIWNFE